jgi:hypothetical protein
MSDLSLILTSDFNIIGNFDSKKHFKFQMINKTADFHVASQDCCDTNIFLFYVRKGVNDKNDLMGW